MHANPSAPEASTDTSDDLIERRVEAWRILTGVDGRPIVRPVVAPEHISWHCPDCAVTWIGQPSGSVDGVARCWACGEPGRRGSARRIRT